MRCVSRTSRLLIPGLAKFRQPPWFFLEMMIVLVIVAVLVSTQSSMLRPYTRQAAFAKAMPYVNEARTIIELYWTLYGVFPADLESAADMPGLRRWHLLDLLSVKENQISDGDLGAGQISYRIDYHPNGRFSLVATEKALRVLPRRVDFVPTVVGKPGVQSVLWQCIDVFGDRSENEGLFGLKVASWPAWCDTQPSMAGR